MIGRRENPLPCQKWGWVREHRGVAVTVSPLEQLSEALRTELGAKAVTDLARLSGGPRAKPGALWLMTAR